MTAVPVHFGIPYRIDQEETEYPVWNGDVYVRYLSTVWVDAGEQLNQAHMYICWCIKDHKGTYGPLRSFEVPYNNSGDVDPQCPDGEMINSMDEAEVSSSDGTGLVDWEIDALEQMEAHEEPEPMEQDPEQDGEVEDRDPTRCF